MARESVSSSSVPKPSSMNMVSSRTPPDEACTTSAKPSASASEARNDSPPERVFTSRSRLVYASSTFSPSPLRVFFLPSSMRHSR